MSYNLIQCSCGCIYAEADGHNCNKVSDAYRIEELEAKLAKAVVFAEIVERTGHGELEFLAGDMLAELKGQNQ
jgi:hypothetical protein